jgi:hypothetical protein
MSEQRLRGHHDVTLAAMRAPALLVAFPLLAACNGDRALPGPTVATSSAPAVAASAAPAAADTPGPRPIFPPAPTSIGTATMLADGTIVISNPHSVSRTSPVDPKYAAVLAHLGGLKPGEEKNAPAWPDDFDAARVETVVRAYLTRNGIDPSGCHGDILGSSKKSVVTSIACKSEGLSLNVVLDSYEVVETGRHKF